MATKPFVTEEWKPVRGWEGRYEISSLGRVRSWAKMGNSHAPRTEPIVRKLVPNKRGGYLTVMFCRSLDGKTERCLKYVHLLVLEAFNGPAPEGMEGRHLNGNVRDNMLTNLLWSTHSENIADQVLHGTHTKGERNARAKLTQGQADAIRSRLAAGEKGADLAREFGVKDSTVTRIKSGQRYARM